MKRLFCFLRIHWERREVVRSPAHRMWMLKFQCEVCGRVRWVENEFK